jgi:hypothetical protein
MWRHQLTDCIAAGFQLEGGVVFMAGGDCSSRLRIHFWRQWTGTGICHHHVPGSEHHADER